MKLLVFAHTPPPHHGQSYMVQLMIDGLGGDRRRQPKGASPPPDAQHGIECYQVNARLSDAVEEVGRVRSAKVPRLLRYCVEAIWCRFRYGVRCFYYIPAPPLRAPLYRDWIVLLLCRPFFKRIIFHWHAVGLGEWLEQEATSFERWITRKLLGGSDMSIVLGPFYVVDVEKFSPKRTAAVPNGIPDPCPDFASVAPRRKARALARQRIRGGQSLTDEEIRSAGGDPQNFRVLFLSLCAREKGLFDAIDAVALVNQKLIAASTPMRVTLSVAGKFFRESDQRDFEQRLRLPDVKDSATGRPFIEYLGFAGGEEKNRLLRESDCLCFPSYYLAEGHPVTLLEAMAYGLPIIATKWRALPELFPEGYPLVEIKSPHQIASVIEQFLDNPPNQNFREQFLGNFLHAEFIQRITRALESVSSEIQVNDRKV